MKPFLIDAPYPLEGRVRALIRQSVSQSLERFGDEEYLYIGERIGPKLEALHGSSTHWVRELWTTAAAFHLALRDHSEGNRHLSQEVRRFVAVGLHYLVNPFDVIPDHIYGDGYTDDALVLNYCTIEITRLEPRLLKSYLRKVRQAAHLTACP
jgi:uncharacterized membrane protein YkvA (DUF1232 family)